jgi:hypothetical protein
LVGGTELPWEERAQASGSRWLAVTALALLLLSVVLFAWMWAHAFAVGAVPATFWGENQQSNGPWRHCYGLRGTLWLIA